MTTKNLTLCVCLLGIAGCTADTSPGTAPDIEADMVEEEVEAGGTVTSDAEGSGTTLEDPVATSITSPNAGTVTIAEEDISQEAPAGIQFIGQQINIDAPPGTVEEPLIIRFELHDSLVPAGETAETLQIFRDGALAQDCSGDAGHASPDPCVTERMEGAGSIEFTVLAVHASAWNWGVLIPGTDADPKGEIDLDTLQQDPWPVTVDGDVASVTVPFSTPLPSKIAALANPGEVITSSVTLVIRSDETGTTANLTSGTLVGGTPGAAGEYTFEVDADRASATLTFFNETPAGTTLKTDRTYTAQLQVSDNDYVESVDAATFVVQPE